jgi:hypothetical protein
LAGRQVALYFAWSHPDEIAAPLGVLEDRFPALFETRRMFWPRFEQFADPAKLLICDTTIWSSTVGGLDSLQRFWRNVVEG